MLEIQKHKMRFGMIKGIKCHFATWTLHCLGGGEGAEKDGENDGGDDDEENEYDERSQGEGMMEMRRKIEEVTEELEEKKKRGRGAMEACKGNENEEARR